MYEKFVKRSLDLISAVTLLVISLPFSAFIALLIKCSSRGPVLFSQPRTGLGGKNFTMYKFRTMAKDNDVLDSSKGDIVTPLGKLLRRTSLDEIPQLINIVRGDMSFIGPRPWITEYYKYMNATQRKRNSVRPGITGLAQAYGRNHLTIHEKIGYDLIYVKNMSVRGDLKVIFVTMKMLLDHGAHEIGKGGIHDELETLKKQGGVA